MKDLWILAQGGAEETSGITSEPIGTEGENEAITTVPGDPNAAAPGPARPRSPIGQFLPFILIFVVMYLLLFRGPRKKQQQHKKRVQSLEKNDKVRTIGGIVGTVVDIHDDEVTLKIDESNNTKIKIVASAIGKNLTKSQEQ